MISDQDLLRSSIVRRVAAKAPSLRTKTASHGGPVSLQDVVQALGTKIAYAHLRRARIANALASVKEI
jgi:hypothetical protein